MGVYCGNVCKRSLKAGTFMTVLWKRRLRRGGGVEAVEKKI